MQSVLFGERLLPTIDVVTSKTLPHEHQDEHELHGTTEETLLCNRITYERQGAVVRNLSNDRRNKKATDWCQVAEKPRQQSLAAALKPNTQTHTRDEGAIGGYAYSTLVCRNALVRTF